MNRWLVAIFSLCILVAGFLFFLPNIVAWQLNKNLGQRSVANLIEDAIRQNTAALLSIEKPLILADIPASLAERAAVEEITRAVSGLELPDDWRVTLVGAPSASFLPNTLRLSAKAQVENAGIGSATLDLSVDAIPQIEARAVVLPLAISSASADRISVHGFRLPWPLPEVITETVQKSLNAINTRLKPVRLEIKGPPSLPGGGEPSAALLLTKDSVAVVLGKRTTSPRPALKGTYEQDFIAAAREIMPDYKPGLGVIAVAESENDLPNTSEALRASSISINLQHTEDLLGTDHTTDPAAVTSDLSPVMLATVAADYFEQQVKLILQDAITKASISSVELIVKPENIHVKTLEGALEANASGSAKFLSGWQGAITIDFTLTAWGVLDPSMTGLRARYAVRDFHIQRLLGKWNELEAPMGVENADALAALVLKLIKELPETTIQIPTISLKLPKQTRDVQVQFEKDEPKIQLLGRTVLLSPDRVMVMTIPTIPGGSVAQQLRWAASDLNARPPAASDFQRLKALFQLSHNKIFGDDPSDQLNLGLRREGLAHLINAVWDFARPSVVAKLAGRNDLPKAEIDAMSWTPKLGQLAKVEPCP
jgi:hypothetical protein